MVGRKVALVLLVACGGGHAAESAPHVADGLDPRTVPADVRPEYLVFADRCSKCHPLARPLKSGIRTDADWAMLVDRMRRQEGSGISRDDAERILRFLHYYSSVDHGS